MTEFPQLRQVQQQTQSLTLAPQLRQSLKILQVPAIELRSTILEELQTNPFLEELPVGDISIETSGAAPEESDLSGEEMDFDTSQETLSALDENWRDYFEQTSSHSAYSREDALKRQYFFDSIPTEISLQEHLIRQAELAELSPEEKKAIHFLVGSVNDRGFLTLSVEEVVEATKLPLETVEKARTVLRHFDPLGIGCLNVQEYLLQQLVLLGKEDSLTAKIVREHYNLFLRRRIPEIAPKVGADMSAVEKAFEELATLDPVPGRRFAENTNQVIIPEVRVEKEEGQWVVYLNEDYIPRLCLSGSYKNLMAQGRLTPKEKEYLRYKMRSGRFLISSIAQRQQTIKQIVQELLRIQHEFFESGVKKLRPLVMEQVAKEIGVHETTVSRAIADKYIQTPHGVFPLKYFFTGGYERQRGESVSATSVKEYIAQMIEGENPAKPYSDQQIVDFLKEKKITIARRTVAKYRDDLGILSTNLRKRYRK